MCLLPDNTTSGCVHTHTHKHTHPPTNVYSHLSICGTPADREKKTCGGLMVLLVGLILDFGDFNTFSSVCAVPINCSFVPFSHCCHKNKDKDKNKDGQNTSTRTNHLQSFVSSHHSRCRLFVRLLAVLAVLDILFLRPSGPFTIVEHPPLSRI
jgi:hypothetical protein